MRFGCRSALHVCAGVYGVVLSMRYILFELKGRRTKSRSWIGRTLRVVSGRGCFLTNRRIGVVVCLQVVRSSGEIFQPLIVRVDGEKFKRKQEFMRCAMSTTHRMPWDGGGGCAHSWPERLSVSIKLLSLAVSPVCPSATKCAPRMTENK